MAIVDDYAINPDHSLELLHGKVTGYCMQVPGKFSFTRRLLGFNGESSDIPFMEIEVDADFKMSICCLDEKKEIWITHEDWKYEREIDNGKPKIRVKTSGVQTNWLKQIHVGELNKTHSVIRFQKKQARNETS